MKQRPHINPATEEDQDIKDEDTVENLERLARNGPQQRGPDRAELIKRFKELESILRKYDARTEQNLVFPMSNGPLAYLRAFSTYIQAGQYPPAEVLLSISDSFSEYLEGKRFSLDSAFRIKSKQKSGTPIRQEQARRKRLDRLSKMAIFRTDDPGITIEDAAEKVLKDEDISNPRGSEVDTLARYYKAKGIGKKLEKDFRELQKLQPRGK